MTPERKELLKQIKKAKKLWTTFFYINFVGCLFASYLGKTWFAILFAVAGVIYFGLIKMNEWYINKLEEFSKREDRKNELKPE